MFTLGRKVDPKIKTNLCIIISVLITSIIGWFFTSDVMSSLYMGGVVFITWALSREIDPPHPYAAFVAVGLTLINLYYIETIETTHLLILFWLILILRMTNGITGKELTVVDIIAVLGFTIILSLTYENIIFLFILLLVSTYLYKLGKQKKYILPMGILLIVLMIIQPIIINSTVLSFSNLKDPLSLFLVVSAGISIVLFKKISKHPCEDDQGKFASLDRIFSAQVLYCITIILLVMTKNLPIHDHIIHLSVLFGSTIYFLGHRMINKQH